MNTPAIRRPLLILTLLLALVLTCTAQDYRTLYRQAEKYYAAGNPSPHTDSAALAGYLRVITSLQNSSSGNDSLLFESYLKAGILQISFQNARNALPLFQSAVTTAKQAHLPIPLLFQPYLYAGSCYYNAYDLDSALVYYKLAEDVLTQFPGLPESERLYNKIGVLYYDGGDYRRSIRYFSKALDLVKSGKRMETAFEVNYRNNIASAMLKLEEYAQAIDIYKSLLPYGSNTDELRYNIGAAYLNAGKADSSIAWLQQVKKGTQARYNTLARACIQLHRYDDAGRNLQLAMAAYTPGSAGQKSQDLANTYKYRGDLLVALDSSAAALTCYQQAIIQLDRDFNDPAPVDNPSSFTGFHNSFLLFDALTAKARAFLSVNNAGVNDLIHAFDAYSSALALARHVETMYYSDDARLFLLKHADLVYKEVVDLGHRLYLLRHDPAWLEKSFVFAETDKAAVLQARLGDPGPDVLKGAARDLYFAARKKQAEAVKLNLLLMNDTATDIQKKMRDIELEVSSLHEKLNQLPEYQRLRSGSGHITISAIQKNILTGDHALLSYFYSRRQLYCFYITRQTFGCITSDSLQPLLNDIRELRQQLDAGNLADRAALQDVTGLVSRHLIDPVYEQVKGKTRLIVIPYNEMAWLPFEILPDPVYRQPLIYHVSLSYDYSANFLNRPGQSRTASYKVLALAPFTALQHSSLEIDGLPGRPLFGKDATRGSFIHWLPRYPIIHLATHAVADDLDPLRSYIELYDGKLFEQEVYHLDLDSAALVILSACETGKGSLIDGEGLISLSRAFSYAGCKSVITSLWKADDAATAYIAKRLHHYLLDGEPRDKALQLAKLDYLNDPDIERRYKTPSYWAHLVLLGDYKPVAADRRGLWLLIGCIVFFLFLLVRCRSIASK